MPNVILKKTDTMTHIMGVLQDSLIERIEGLTRKRFTGTLSVRLECAFNQGGLRSIKKNISQEETIEREKSL